MITLISVILVHEIGHLMGGLISHYRFIMIEVLGLALIRTDKGFKIRTERNLPMGQCLMYTEQLSQNPQMLILGGCVANIAVGLCILIAGMSADSFGATLVCIWFGGINLVAGLTNLLPESVTSDGGTLRDVRISADRAEIYNKLMLVYMYLENGVGYAQIPKEILEAPTLYDSTLAAELAVYRYFRLRELAEQNEVYEDEARVMLINLARYEPGTGVAEVFRGI